MQRLTNNIFFNLAVLTFGAAVYSFGIKDIVVAKGLMSGGVSGVALLLFYLTGALGPGVYYFLLNLPLMVLGWVSLSRRFILYTVYGMGILSLFMQLLPERALIADPLLAAVFGGAVMGAGSGIMLRTLGSAGGTDILAIWLNQKYNLRIGQFNFVFNLAVFAAGMAFYDPTLALYSIILSYANSKVMDYVLALFNQRKMVFIISDKADAIARDIISSLKRGATFLHGAGAYTGKSKRVILTITNTVEIKRLEELVFSHDPNAFFVVENTFNVLGEGFSRRKVY
ncbi:YitT family protein [Solidesulfovibrio carbinolicus]|uniref:YitT family protein n=1 Tax=Solidesulfovibrio carbinolicus TaxID=296842 RepID=A0A4P6HM94_9BACT|nr:YitT family protein [Solidesulfovibrio carbinolicus]QAZ68301.1 YitT family protein [Solidesulfovibrio carbinolicus]